jgi:hypothetical protein
MFETEDSQNCNLFFDLLFGYGLVFMSVVIMSYFPICLLLTSSNYVCMLPYQTIITHLTLAYGGWLCVKHFVLT